MVLTCVDSLLQDALNRPAEVIEEERLSKRRTSVKLEVGAKGCDEDDFRRIRQLRQAASELIAIEPGHEQITDHKVDLHARMLYYRQSLFAVCCSQDPISLLFQRLGNDVADTVVVVDYQHGEREWLRGCEGLHVRLSLFSEAA
jgi:hypothetical protein